MTKNIVKRKHKKTKLLYIPSMDGNIKPSKEELQSMLDVLNVKELDIINSITYQPTDKLQTVGDFFQQLDDWLTETHAGIVALEVPAPAAYVVGRLRCRPFEKDAFGVAWNNPRILHRVVIKGNFYAYTEL